MAYAIIIESILVGIWAFARCRKAVILGGFVLIRRAEEKCQVSEALVVARARLQMYRNPSGTGGHSSLCDRLPGFLKLPVTAAYPLTLERVS